MLPEVAQSRHPVETGEHQYVQSYSVEKCKGSRVPAQVLELITVLMMRIERHQDTY